MLVPTRVGIISGNTVNSWSSTDHANICSFKNTEQEISQKIKCDVKYKAQLLLNFKFIAPTNSLITYLQQT